MTETKGQEDCSYWTLPEREWKESQVSNAANAVGDRPPHMDMRTHLGTVTEAAVVSEERWHFLSHG